MNVAVKGNMNASQSGTGSLDYGVWMEAETGVGRLKLRNTVMIFHEQNRENGC